MKVTSPQMGNLEILLKDIFARLGVEYIAPPKSSNKTLSIGSKISPDLACMPLKITVGNLIEGLEMGADTVVMTGGYGPCRFGYYAQIQKIVLEQAGYKFDLITVEPPGGGLSEFLAAFRKLAPGKSTWQIWKIIKVSFQKLRAVDFIDKKCLQLYCFETKNKEVSSAKEQALKWLDQAYTSKEIEQALDAGLKLLDSLDIDKDKKCLKVGLTGEFYLLLEPFANFDIETFLGRNGVYLERGVYVSDWIAPFPNNIVFGERAKHIEELAKPYISHWVGGEGQDTVGHTVNFANKGFDGIVHLLPFTCMPEIIAQSVLPTISQKFDIPILTLVVDEQTGRAGVVTRLEAFLDLLASRKAKSSYSIVS